MQGKLFQRCTHLLYCSVLSLGGNLNTKRMSKPDMGSLFHRLYIKFLIFIFILFTDLDHPIQLKDILG